ncbi:MAG: hypothetical protein HQL45_10565 [Alphaproteobacteria bacterium]|nr:hypothetical protein [Alphaproteobacteria bacterium]
MTPSQLNSLFDAPPAPTKRAKNAKRISDDALLSLTALAQLVKAKPRALQLWTDAGALKPLDGTDRKGSGAWRLYGREESELAAILAEAHQGFRLPVGMLALLAGAVRQSQEQPASTEAFERARRGTHAVWLIGAPKGEDYAISYATGAVLSLSSSPGNGAALRDCGAILVVNLTAALGRLNAS